jgi:hypothetical protein
LFGDQLNATNVTGCAIVFSGVILYKVVFHIEKAEKMEMAVHEKNRKENVGSKLMDGSGDADADGFKDEPGEVDFVQTRGVELVDRRSSGKSPMLHRKMIKDNGDIDDEGEHVPSLRLM